MNQIVLLILFVFPSFYIIMFLFTGMEYILIKYKEAEGVSFLSCIAVAVP